MISLRTLKCEESDAAARWLQARRSRNRGRRRPCSHVAAAFAGQQPRADVTRPWVTRGHADGPGRPGRTGRVQPDDVSPRLELLGPAGGRAAPSFYRRRLGPTGRCCASTRSFAVDREIEIAPGDVLPGLDVQRPGARPDASRHGRRSRPRDVRQPGLAPAHDSLPRLASARDGRLAAGARGHAGRPLRLRVRRRAVRPAPVPLPRGAAEAPHPQGTLRRVHRRSARRRARRPTSS